MPCGVTVEVILPITASAAWITPTPRSLARIASSCSSSSTNNVSIAGGSAASASRMPCAPSTRNRRSSSRNARLRSRAAAATFGFLVLEITRPPGAPVERSVDPRDRGTIVRSGGRRLGKRVLGLLHQGGERGRVVDREVGKHLAVELDPGVLEPVHEARVRDAVGTHARVDAGDPEPAELRLAVTAVAVGVDARAGGLFLGEAVPHPAAAGVALGGRERLAALLLRVNGSFDSCHRYLASRRLIFFCSPVDATSAMPSTRRRRLPLFLVSMWLPVAL